MESTNRERSFPVSSLRLDEVDGFLGSRTGYQVLHEGGHGWCIRHPSGAEGGEELPLRWSHGLEDGLVGFLSLAIGVASFLEPAEQGYHTLG